LYSEDSRNDHHFALNYYPSFDHQGKVASVVVYATDITERKKESNSLRESEERFRQMFERNSAVMLLIEPQSGIIVDANPAAASFYGYPLIYLKGKEIGSITVQTEEQISHEIQQAIVEERNYNVFDHRLANSELRTVEVHSSPVTFKSRSLLFAIIHDITDRKIAEEQIRLMAFHDTLTKIPNRRLLIDRLDQTLASSKRNSIFGALMFLDLDNFKMLNDTHGHKLGDLLLIEAARRIGSCIRKTDTVARFGGDEFVVMLGMLDEDQIASELLAGAIAGNILESLSAPYLLTPANQDKGQNTVEHCCTASIGVTIFNGDSGSHDDILKRADTAMYEAKQSGRNRIHFYENT
jgi:diguanylate cyclase (GGDEF)-like protein/PAS domain S-box-containing protein